MLESMNKRNVHLILLPNKFFALPENMAVFSASVNNVDPFTAASEPAWVKEGA